MKSMTWYHFNWFDFVIIGIIGLSIIVSFFRGFLRESVSLITWVVAVILAVRFATPITSELHLHIESANIRFLIGFVIIFILVLIAGLIVNLIISFFVKKTGVSLFDRLLGLLFGAVRGLLAIAILLMLLYVTPWKDAMWLKSSQLSPHFKPIINWLHSFLPNQIKEISEWFKENKNLL